MYLVKNRCLRLPTHRENLKLKEEPDGEEFDSWWNLYRPQRFLSYQHHSPVDS